MNENSNLIFLLIVNYSIGAYNILQGRNIKKNPKTFLPFRDRMTLRIHRNRDKEEYENLETYLKTPSRLKLHANQYIALGVLFISWPFLVWIWYLLFQ